MARICGVISMDGPSGVAECFKQLCDVSWRDVDGDRQVWSNDYAALGHLKLDPKAVDKQPLCGDDGSRQVRSGKLVDTAEVRKQLSMGRKAPFAKDNDSAMLFDLLSSKRYDLLEQLNGLFTAALWQPVEKRLTLVNDRLGFRPLYYSYDVKAQKFVFSSDLRGVVAVLSNRKINWQAASVFLHFGHHLGEATWFEDIHVLPPGSVLQVEHKSVLIKRYWDVGNIPIDETIGHREAVEGIVDTFKTSIRRRLEVADTRKIVFLSGGIDSRRIAAEMKYQGSEYSTYTTRGFSNFPGNRSLAAEVAETLKVPNTFINLPKNNFLSEYWPRCNSLLDYESNLHQWMLPLVDSFSGFAGVNYDGLGGDVLVNGVLRTSEFNNPDGSDKLKNITSESLAKRLVDNSFDCSFLAKNIRQELSYDSVVSAVTSELKRYEHMDNQLTYFYLLNRTRRSIALSPMRLISRKLECLLPYLDNDFVEFSLGIPLRIRLAHPLRRESLDSAYPYLKQVGNTDYKPRHGRVDGLADDINFKTQRRLFLRQCIRQHYINNNRIFTNHRVLPKIFKDSMLRYLKKDHISSVFRSSLEVFYEFIGEYYECIE